MFRSVQALAISVSYCKKLSYHRNPYTRPWFNTYDGIMHNKNLAERSVRRIPSQEEVGFTMRHRIAMGVVAVAALAVSVGVAGDALKSGPQAGQPLGGPFNVLNVTGKNAGKSLCLV
jgi:hypothetical protein